MLVFSMRRYPVLRCLFESCTALIALNILINKSPDFMDVHYAPICVGNVTITFAMIRALLGYSAGLLLYDLYKVLCKSCNQNKKTTIILGTLLQAAVLVGLVVLYSPSDYNRELDFLFPFLCFVFILFCCVFKTGIISRFFQLKRMQFIGDNSLSIYLVHMFWVVLLPSNGSVWEYILLVFVSAIVYTWVCNKLKELLYKAKFVKSLVE